MSEATRPRYAPAPVEPLDTASRQLVPRALEPDARTGRDLEQDLPSTEPDGAASDALARVRDSVLSGLRLVEDARQKTPLEVRASDVLEELVVDDRPTAPSRLDSGPSDVFAPIGARARLLDEAAPTPRDRPFRHVDHERPTDLDPREAPTATYHAGPAVQPRPAAPEPEARAQPRDQERLLVLSVYDSVRAHHALSGADTARAAHVTSLSEHLRASGSFSDRDLLLAVHAREKRALLGAPEEVRREREDRVMALGLLAYEVDVAHRDQMRAFKDQLIGELGALPQQKRDAVYADFESFAERDGANDSNLCRRELFRALKEEQELHKAYVYALALEKTRRDLSQPPPRAPREADAERRA
ncbi:MAG: hypothetical protein IT383_27455 [Deltaproteobacteria bacterium]|nr:hypothetical protein [Deltaproteobacteria bacterium]